MFYKIPLEPLPKVTEVSKVVRKTTWRCADKRNILVFMQKGSCYFYIDGQNILLQQGEVLLIPAETPYIRRALNDEVATLFYVHFLTDTPFINIGEEEVQEEVFKRLEKADFLTTAIPIKGEHLEQNIYLKQKIDFSKDYDAIFTQLRNMRHECTKSMDYYHQTVLSLSLAKLLVHFSQMVISQIKTAPLKSDVLYPPSLQKALLYVQKHYKQKISLESIADAAGVSVQHVIRLFRKHLDITPLEYVNRTKVLHAIDMLRNTDLTVKEISYELGFDNPNYFSRLFKKEEKMTPVETRKRIQNFPKEKKPSPIQ